MRELSRVKIVFANGALGSVTPSDDGVVGLIASGSAVPDKFALEKPYQITELGDLKGLGITAGTNKTIYDTVTQFYTEAPKGTNLWLMGVADTVKVSEVFDENPDDDESKYYVRNLIEASNCSINLLIVKKNPQSDTANRTISGETGELVLDADVYEAMGKAHNLATAITNELFAPFFVLLEGRHYDPSKDVLKDLAKYEFNRVGILVADVEPDTKGACVGLLAGRIASIPVQRSIARVKTGAIKNSAMYIGKKTVQNGKPERLHSLGYITARTFVGKAGYYWSDDLLATQVADDYALIPRRRIIDKAYRIAYKTLVEEVGEEIPVTDAGEIPAPIAKSIQNKVERAIQSNMTNFGNLGNDPSNANDIGVTCYIDPKQNIMSDSRLEIQIRVKPYAYAKYINVSLGFKVVGA